VTKTCTKCGKEQPPDSFYRDARARDGRESRCRACRKAYKKAYHDTPRGNLRRRLNGMHQRCYNPNHSAYPYYGGRGINVCWDWHLDNPQGFDNFLEWAVSNGYEKHLDIDRINNDQGYSPDNCRFVDRSTNIRNQRPRGGTSAFRGVCWFKSASKWHAQITLPDGTRKHLGYFHSEKEAARAYDRAAFTIYGTEGILAGEIQLNCLEQPVR